MSSIFKLNANDLLKGLIVSVLSAVFATLGAVIQNTGFVLSKENLLMIAGVATTTALGYLSKQLLTDDEGKIGGVKLN